LSGEKISKGKRAEAEAKIPPPGEGNQKDLKLPEGKFIPTTPRKHLQGISLKDAKEKNNKAAIPCPLERRGVSMVGCLEKKLNLYLFTSKLKT